MELLFRITDTPTAQEAVFSHVLRAGGEAFTEADVRAALGLPKTTVHIALHALVQQGLVVEEHVGRTGRFSVDVTDPLVRQLKIASAVRRVQEAMTGLLGRADLVVLFGSASRGEDRSESDVDVLVVTPDAEHIETELARHQWLQPVVMTPEKHMVLIAEDGTFARETARGITIWELR